MKKYKLLKIYKGSPKINTEIVETMIMGSRPKFRTFTISGPNKGDFRIDNPEISPEYWEEIVEYPIGTKATDTRINKTFVKKVDGWYNSNRTAHTDESISGAKWINIVENEIVEKDYEILSFKQNSGITDLWTNFGLNPNCWCRNKNNFAVTSGYTLEQILNNPLYSIHSVKRLSDGEVFTVGDNLSSNANIFTLDSIILDVHMGLRISPYEVVGTIALKNVVKCKKPLFTTEDGVDVIPKIGGEFQYWSLKLDNWRISDAPHILNSNTIIPISTKDLLRCCNELRFSTKEKAEEYILLNKQHLSMQDLKNTGCISQIQWDIILDYIRTTKL